MRLIDRPLLYVAILSLLFKFVAFLLLLQFSLFIISLGTIGLSLTFYLSCIILFLCEEYVIGLLASSNYDIKEDINELDP